MSAGMRAFGPIAVIAGILVLLLAFTIPPTYFRLDTVLVCASAVFAAVMMVKNGHPVLGGAFIVAAVIVNPLVQLAFLGWVWVTLVAAIAILFLVTAYFVRGPGPEPDPDDLPERLF